MGLKLMVFFVVIVLVYMIIIIGKYEIMVNNWFRFVYIVIVSNKFN